MRARDAVLQRVMASARGKAQGPVRVGVDGRSTAGKTTFAEDLARVFSEAGHPTLRASIDDFHTPGHKFRSMRGEYTPETFYDEAFDYLRFRSWVLDPLARGGDRRCRLRSWIASEDEPAPPEVVRAPDAAVLVVDGSFLLRSEFAGCWELTVWLEIDFDRMIQRAVERDTAWVGDPEVVRRRYTDHFVAVHRLYEEATDVRARVNWLIDNTRPELPRVLRAPAVPELGG